MRARRSLGIVLATVVLCGPGTADAFTVFGQAPFVESFGGWGRAGLLVNGPRLATLLAQRPDLAQPYAEIRAATPQLNEDPNAILLPLVGQGVLDHTNATGDLDPAPPTPATDDWPLMYLRDPALPWVYLAGLAMVGVIALGLIFGLAPATARRGFSPHMFFLGAAFMLLETRSLVTFSLLFGSTWLVTSANLARYDHVRLVDGQGRTLASGEIQSE